MAIQSVFARREIKYLITQRQKDIITAEMAKYMYPDEYGRSTVCSLYYDTPSHMLIRRSSQSPLYKEKLRLRSYGAIGENDTAFVEIKKKFKGVVYKRRVGMELKCAMQWLGGSPPPHDTSIKPRRAQIMNEIDFFISRYENLAPAMFISAEREAFYGIDDREFRITFDDNILWRETELSLSSGIFGNKLLEEEYILMEVKAGGAIPLWACRMFSSEGIFKTKFSKYGTAYRSTLAAEYMNLHNKGEHDNVTNF